MSSKGFLNLDKLLKSSKVTQCTSYHPGLPQIGVIPNSIPFPLKSLGLEGKVISSTGNRRETSMYCISVLEDGGISIWGARSVLGGGERDLERQLLNSDGILGF